MIEPHLRLDNPTYSVVSYPAPLLPKQYTALIFSKWLRSFLYGNKDLQRKIDHHDYFKSYHKSIEEILEKPDATIRLAVLTDDPDVVLGFAVHRGTVLDYLYVHRDMRKQGIGTNLVPDIITGFTHMTNLVASIFAGSTKYKFSNIHDALDPACRYFTFNPKL
jgi:GNAT superfamily N-acetyltransferase